MVRRAFSLVELLAVVAILAALAALLFPVFARSQARARETSCAARLGQFANALNLYRADHDGKGYRWSLDLERPVPDHSPYTVFDGMRGYLTSPSVLDCPEPPSDPPFGTTRTVYRTVVTHPSSDRPSLIVEAPLEPRPGTVVAYCDNHHAGDWDPRFGGSLIRAGAYPFAREDASVGVTRSETIQPAFYDEAGWYEATSRSPVSSILRFPGEPWPPTPEE